MKGAFHVTTVRVDCYVVWLLFSSWESFDLIFRAGQKGCLKVCLKAADWIVCLEGCLKVCEQLQTRFCAAACRRAGALAEAVPELGLPSVDFVPDTISAA